MTANQQRRFAIFTALVLTVLLIGCGGGTETGASLSAHSSAVLPVQAPLLGDMDNDGNPSVGDAIRILRIVVGLDPDDPCADANQNGATDVGDAVKMLRCVVGFDEWPIVRGDLPQCLLYEDFEAGLGAWFDIEHPQRMYTTDRIAYAGDRCLEMIFRPGDGEVGPGWMLRRFFPERTGTPLETEGVEEVFMRVFQRFSSNWQWPAGGDGPHNLYLLAGDVDGLATTELTVYLEFRNLHPLAMICGAHQDIDYQDWEATGAAPVELDRWYCLEIRARMNDPGHSNGIIQVWLDNQQVLDVAGVTMRHNGIGLDGTTLSFHEMAVGPWYHGGIYSPDPMYVWMDELAVSTQRIGTATMAAGAALSPASD